MPREILVRDNTPGQLVRGGGRITIRQARPAEYREMLTERLRKAVIDFCCTGSADELADVVSLCDALNNALHPTGKTLLAVVEARDAEHGEFSGTLLILDD